MQRTISTSNGSSDASRVIDGRPPPDRSSVHMVYIDNFVNKGCGSSSVQECASAGNHVLRRSGMVVHKEESVKEGAIVTSWQFAASTFRPSKARVWKARLAVREMLRCNRASGKALEHLVGHMPFICFGRREAFSVLGAVYAFIHKCYSKPCVLRARSDES